MIYFLYLSRKYKYFMTSVILISYNNYCKPIMLNQKNQYYFLTMQQQN